MTKQEEISGILTLDILEEAVSSIRKIECDNEVIGFKIHPADFGEIKARTMCFCGVVNESLVMIPPYQGLRLELDVNQPRGYVKAIRRQYGN